MAPKNTTTTDFSLINLHVHTLLKRGVTGTPIVKVFMYTHGIYNTLGEYCSTWGVVEHHKCHFTPQ